MTTLSNEIIIHAPIQTIWEELAILDRLEVYDPNIKMSKTLSKNDYGLGAQRIVHMNDDKNWFKETCTVYDQHVNLKYELDSCSFPVHKLYHRYYFEKINDHKYKVTQIQSYKMKYGVLGNFMGIVIKPKWNKGIRAFLDGLKSSCENQ